MPKHIVATEVSMGQNDAEVGALAAGEAVCKAANEAHRACRQS